MHHDILLLVDILHVNDSMSSQWRSRLGHSYQEDSLLFIEVLTFQLDAESRLDIMVFVRFSVEWWNINLEHFGTPSVNGFLWIGWGSWLD